MEEVNTLADVATRSILSSKTAILSIGDLPNLLQQHLFVSALESDLTDSISVLFKACSLQKIDAAEIATRVEKMNADDESSNHEDVIAETLLFGYMSALRTLQNWTSMPELHIAKLNLRPVLKQIDETRRHLKSNPEIGTGYTVKTGLLSITIVAHLGLSPEAGLSKFLSENMVTRRGPPTFRVVYKNAHVSCADYPDFIKDVLEYLDNDIESLSLDCSSSLRSPLVVLKRFGKLKNLEIKTIENEQDLRHLGSILNRMRLVEKLSFENSVESRRGPIEIVLKRCRALKAFKYWSELISDNDLIWLGQSKHRETLTVINFNSVDFRSSNEMSHAFANFDRLEALSLQNCNLSKNQVVQLCVSIQHFQRISIVNLDQHTREAEGFTNEDSIEILTPLLCTKSDQLKKIVIDVPSSQDLNLQFLADCKDCIKKHDFGNIFGALIVNDKHFNVGLREISKKTLSDEYVHTNEVLLNRDPEASFLFVVNCIYSYFGGIESLAIKPFRLGITIAERFPLLRFLWTIISRNKSNRFKLRKDGSIFPFGISPNVFVGETSQDFLRKS